MKYLALLRGINVGGKNIIKMSALQKAFVEMGFSSVQTYIQSGNVIFESENNNSLTLTEQIERSLSEIFEYKSKIVLITDSMLKQIIEEAPPGFGSDPDNYKYDFVFLRFPLTASEVFSQIKVREGVDSASCGTFALYFTRLTSMSSRSYLGKVMSLPVYKELSIRNYNTTVKLSDLLK